MENVSRISIRLLALVAILAMFVYGVQPRNVAPSETYDMQKWEIEDLKHMDGDTRFLRTRKGKDWVEDENCGVHKVEQIHLVMDRVCEMCHEMFSHQLSSLRAQCRNNCFDNKFFRNCLKLFSETKSERSPSERRIPNEPIMTLDNF